MNAPAHDCMAGSFSLLLFIGHDNVLENKKLNQKTKIRGRPQTSLLICDYLQLTSDSMEQSKAGRKKLIFLSKTSLIAQSAMMSSTLLGATTF